MLKIVPDPPQCSQSARILEDTLVEASDYLMGALIVARQTVLLQPKSAGSMSMLTVLHEVESARALVEAAIAYVQRRGRPPAAQLH
ncbi:hypothetical protein [Pseudomonas shirazensis]|uniref:hypothetical protein n=1 Tax=Pseudomonas shirazensis TaxID=2745494 RepID=UPI003D26CA15